MRNKTRQEAHDCSYQSQDSAAPPTTCFANFPKVSVRASLNPVVLPACENVEKARDPFADIPS